MCHDDDDDILNKLLWKLLWLWDLRFGFEFPLHAPLHRLQILRLPLPTRTSCLRTRPMSIGQIFFSLAGRISDPNLDPIRLVMLACAHPLQLQPEALDAHQAQSQGRDPRGLLSTYSRSTVRRARL